MTVTWGRQKRIFKSQQLFFGDLLWTRPWVGWRSRSGLLKYWSTECLFQKKIISKMYSCTYFGHYRKLYSCTTDDEITMCVSWFVCFFFLPKRESSSKMWSEIVNWLTLKCMQDMITFCFQQNYKGESMCYVTRGNSNKQETWCSDSHNWKRWLRYTHLCYFNQVMRTTISWFFLFSCLWRLPI